MESAIREAEREAELASKAAASAATQLKAWSAGERAVISSLKRLGVAIAMPEFQAASVAFVSAHKHVFTFTDENKLEYTTLHEAYVELMEKTLIQCARDVDLDELADSGKFDVVRGVGRLWGAQGFGHGLYVADPDGNVVELRTYG